MFISYKLMKNMIRTAVDTNLPWSSNLWKKIWQALLPFPNMHFTSPYSFLTAACVGLMAYVGDYCSYYKLHLYMSNIKVLPVYLWGLVNGRIFNILHHLGCIFLKKYFNIVLSYNIYMIKTKESFLNLVEFVEI